MIFLFISVSFFGQQWYEISKAYPSAKEKAGSFCGSISISESSAIIETLDKMDPEESINRAGAACFYENIEGYCKESQRLISSDLGFEDFFGISVSMDGNFAVVGAPGEDEDTLGGNTMELFDSAYLFKRNTNENRIETQKIVASDRAPEDGFGHAGAPALGKNDLFVSSASSDQIQVCHLLQAQFIFLTRTLHSNISNNEYDNLFSMYPNPTDNGSFFVDLGKKYDSVTVKIIKRIGKRIYRQRYKSEQKTPIQLSETSDICFLEVEAPNW